MILILSQKLLFFPFPQESPSKIWKKILQAHNRLTFSSSRWSYTNQAQISEDEQIHYEGHTFSEHYKNLHVYFQNPKKIVSIFWNTYWPFYEHVLPYNDFRATCLCAGVCIQGTAQCISCHRLRGKNWGVLNMHSIFIRICRMCWHKSGS